MDKGSTNGTYLNGKRLEQNTKYELYCDDVINFSKVKLYVYRTRCDQEYGIARPCPSCMAAIRDLGIRHIYYTTNNGYAYEEVENNRLEER